MSDNDNDDYSESDVEQEYYDDYTIANEHEVHRDTNMPPINILTENDIVGYLQERFRQAENNTLYWHPLMRLIISKYPDLTEMLLGTIELILDIPIQLNIVHETFKIDLNDTSVIIPYDNRLFIDAKHFVKKLLSNEDKIITLANIRPRAGYLFLVD